MANKTIKFNGRGFGSTPAEITVYLDGVVVFSGAIPTVDEAPSHCPMVPMPEFGELFSIDVDVDFVGEKPMSIVANVGSVLLTNEEGNYTSTTAIFNPVYDAGELAIIQDPATTHEQRMAIYEANAVPPLSAGDLEILNTPPFGVVVPEQQQILRAHNCALYSSDTSLFSAFAIETRSNVYIDGIAQDPVRQSEQDGTLYWLVLNGSTIEFDHTFVAPAQLPL